VKGTKTALCKTCVIGNGIMEIFIKEIKEK
jgi:hypothetical protein